MDITFFRALKIFWSFAWRGMVLTLVVVLPLEAITFGVLLPTMPKLGQKPDAHAVKQMSLVMLIAWPFLMAVVIGVQTQAVRWMIRKARWSDFRLVLMPRDAGSIIDASPPASNPMTLGPRQSD